MRVLRLSFVLALTMFALSSPSAAQSYTVMDLGTLGGFYSLPIAMNNVGQVVGQSTLSSHPYSPYHAFVWSTSSGMQDLGLLNGGDYTSVATGINNSGEVVGASYGLTTESAYLWTESEGMINIGSLGTGFAVAFGINDHEQVVGESILPDGFSHAFLWTRSTGMKDLGTLGGNYSRATGINNAGQVIGYSYRADNSLHAFLWTSKGGMQDLGTFGGTFSLAYAINLAGQVVGESSTPSGNFVAFLCDPVHGMVPLGSNQVVGAFGINSLGEVVGFARTATASAAYAWTASLGVEVLNNFMSHDDGLATYGSAVNDVGQIVVQGSRHHALLLTPVE